MKKILLVLIGGTICTAVNERGHRAIDEKAATFLQHSFMASDSVYREQVTFDVSENFGILSENMTLKRWNQLLSYFRSVSFGEGYDGVVIAHGTDTLGYSAAMFSLLFSGTPIPVFLVSSQHPLANPLANGHVNFKSAVECICENIPPNVYVTYRNDSDQKLYLHLASRLRQCTNYNDDFYSEGAMDITNGLSGEIRTHVQTVPCVSCVDKVGDWQLENHVLPITPYVGIDYSAFCLDGVKAVLHGTYHTGTACAQITGEQTEYDRFSVLSLLDRCSQKGIAVYLAPSRKEGEVYETIPLIANHPSAASTLYFLYGCTWEMAYAKLLLAYSLGYTGKQVEDFFNHQYMGEFFTQKEKDHDHKIV
ncbi:MAG: asparaginase [Clostridia bacterium]|nr:asparaginase [Clostridia bacterium]